MNVLDLFSGIGGFSLGLERAGFKTVAFCEIDKKCHLVLKKHWPNVPIFDDVKNLKGDDINEKIEIICGGFPCQDISFAGKGAGIKGERSGLWQEFHRLIKEIKPKYAIIENVSALRSRGLEDVLRSLAEIGYDAQWHCIPACAIGAPHRRDRIWIIAYPNDEKQHASPLDAKMEKSSEFMADSDDTRNRTFKLDNLLDGAKDIKERESVSFYRASGCGSDVSSVITRRIEEELASHRYASRWEIESDICRVANGISARVDRIKQLGNSIVPQLAELIGSSIRGNE